MPRNLGKIMDEGGKAEQKEEDGHGWRLKWTFAWLL